jgi:arylsulfatase A-like enzyme
MAVVLIAAKSFGLDPRHLDRWLLDLPLVSHEDVMFALCLGLIGEFAVRGANPARRWTRLMLSGIIGVFVFSCLYSVIAAGVFEYFGRPLTFDLLKLVRGAAAMKSSIGSQLTIPTAIALIGVPTGYYAIARRVSRRQRMPYLCFALAAVWVAVGSWQYYARPKEWQFRQLAKSPHLEMVQSAWSSLVGRPKPALPADFPAAYKDEFKVIGDRDKLAASFEPPGGKRPRNVIVLVLESVGTKYLSLYGSPYRTTPGLESEAQNALVFDHFYAHVPYTFCSFMALNFGLYPGLPWCYLPGENFGAEGKRSLPPTLATLFKRRGGRTAYFHNGDMEWGGMDYVLAGQGYDVVEDYRDMDCPPLTSWGAEDRFLVDHLIRWIDRKPGDPFFAFCWTDQTHDPYQYPPRFKPVDFFGGQPPKNHAADLARYLNVIHETDKHVKRLFDALRERGIADETLVVITGDHGEAFADPHDQRGHGFTVYQEDLNVPLILWNPVLFPKGSRESAIGGHVDLNATIADLIGLDLESSWQGYSMLDPKRPQRTFFLASIGDFIFGIRDGRWKYSIAATGDQEMLFDILNDPREEDNRIDAEPDTAKGLRERVAAWVSFEDEFLTKRAD